MSLDTKIVAEIASPPGGGERCVIVTGYLRAKFFQTDLINKAPLLEIEGSLTLLPPKGLLLTRHLYAIKAPKAVA
jgi:hypothetical protein